MRKLREAWLALRVERAHTKDEILEAYLNTIYLGQRFNATCGGTGQKEGSLDRGFDPT